MTLRILNGRLEYNFIGVGVQEQEFDNVNSRQNTGYDIEYDVKILSGCSECVGGLEFTFSDSGSFKDTGIPDQNGLSVDCDTNLSAYAYNKWYHRKICISGYDNEYLSDFKLCADKTVSADVTVSLKNIKLTASGLVKDWIFRQGAKEAPQASGLLETFVENRLVDCIIKDSIIDPISVMDFELETESGRRNQYYKQYDPIQYFRGDIQSFDGRIDNSIVKEGVVKLEASNYLKELKDRRPIKNFFLHSDTVNDISGEAFSMVTGGLVSGNLSVSGSWRGVIVETGEAKGKNYMITNNTDSTIVCSGANFASDGLSGGDGFVIGYEYSNIIEELVDSYCNYVRYSGLVRTEHYSAKVYKGISAFEICKELAKNIDYKFGIDDDRYVIFSDRLFDDSGITLERGSDYIVDSKFTEQGKEVINRVSVYGGVVSGVQIQALIDDHASQLYYGTVENPYISEEEIVDTDIVTLEEANARGNAYLRENAWSIRAGDIVTVGTKLRNIRPGQLINLKILDKGIDGSFLILEKEFDLSDRTTTIKVAQYIAGLEDILIDYVNKLRRYMSTDIDESSVGYNILREYEDVGIYDSISMYKRGTSNSFLLNHPIAGRLGTSIPVALEFDASESHLAYTGDNQYIGDAITIVLEFSTLGSITAGRIASSGGSKYVFQLIVRSAGGNEYIGISFSPTGASPAAESYSQMISGGLQTNTTYRAIGLYDPTEGKYKAYLNDTEYLNLSGAAFYNTFGAFNVMGDFVGPYCDGILENTQMYARTITSAEISTNAIKPTDLFASYDVNEATGITLYDKGPYGHDLTLYGLGSVPSWTSSRTGVVQHVLGNRDSSGWIEV